MLGKYQYLIGKVMLQPKLPKYALSTLQKESDTPWCTNSTADINIQKAVRCNAISSTTNIIF